MSLTKATFSMISGAAANVVDFGADPTGGNIAATTAAFQAAVASNLNVFVPEGTYTINSPITLRAGQNIHGVNGGQFSGGSSITNNVVGGGIFWMADGTGAPGQVDGPTISNFTLTADYPIKLNPEDEAIFDGSAAPTPYIMKPRIENCFINALSIGAGTGISFSKVFDFIIERCHILGFDIGILLQGCDIGRVTTNRLVACTSYHILEISVGTFGSQNWIENNDILSGAPGCVYIKSCSRHVRIYNNYLENQTASGAIDLTNIDCPQYGTNVPRTPLTIICTDNRVDGQDVFTDFVYRLDGDFPSISTVLHDPGTSGSEPSASKILSINNDYLPLLYNGVHAAAYDIAIQSSYEYFDFLNTQKPLTNYQGVTIDAKALFTCSGIVANNAGYQCGYNGSDSIVIRPTMVAPASPLYIYLPVVNSTIVHPLTPGVSYDIYVTARSPSSETLNASYLKTSGGGALTGFALTPAYKTFKIATVSAPATTENFGAYFSRATTTDDIFIQSISFVPV